MLKPPSGGGGGGSWLPLSIGGEGWGGRGGGGGSVFIKGPRSYGLVLSIGLTIQKLCLLYHMTKKYL